MRIAVIGAGISGNLCARLLHGRHEVTLFEANAYPGGHTNTVDIEAYGQQFAVDTGFMVFNDRTYPGFLHLLERLGIAPQPSDMSFSVRCDRTGWEYQGSSLAGLFADRRNLVRPAFYRLLADIVRFNRRALSESDRLDERLTLEQFLAEARYGSHLLTHYLAPMTAAIWSAPPSQVRQMPARFLFQFFRNHGLLHLRNRPRWMTIPGGARRYVQAMLEPLRNSLRLNAKVVRVERWEDRVDVLVQGAHRETFDAVVFACHADQVLAMLADATEQEQRVLRCFPYQRNEATVHTDARLLPRHRAAWASWNYHIAADPGLPVVVTYDLNRLQCLRAPGPLCVTLNGQERIAPDKVLGKIVYHHPVFGPGTLAAQRDHSQLNGQRRSYFCGAYWRYGFHEDGVQSALAVCQSLGLDWNSWKAASTKDMSATGVSCP